MNAVFCNTFLILVASMFIGQSALAISPCQDQEPEQSALYRRATDLFHNGQYLLSSIHFSQLSASRCNPQLAAQSLFSYSLRIAELGESSEAIRNLSPLENSTDLALREKAELFHSFLAPEVAGSLSPSSLLRLGLWNSRNSDQEFSSLIESPLLENTIRVKLQNIHQELVQLPTKNLWVAGVFSAVIPGAGQVYGGSFQSAAIALVLNSLFLATTLEFAQHKMAAAAVASATIFSVTYIGNILNAVDMANRFNTNVRASSNRILRDTLFPEFNP